MNKVEVAKILTRASAVDNRIVTEETVEAWFELLQAVDYQSATVAVIEHFKTSTEYLLPGHVVSGARKAREQFERDRKRDAMLNPTSEERLSLEASAELRKQPIPQCEHGISIVRCAPCCVRLAEENS